MSVLAVKVVPEAREDGVYLHIFGADLSEEVIGPLEDGAAYNVQLQGHEIKGAAPPGRRMRKAAAATEERIAEDVGGRTQPNSGAVPGYKGDVRKRGKHRIEAKTAKGVTFNVHREMLNKIRSECGPGEKPAFVICFVDPKFLREQDKWVLIPYEDWHEAHVDRRSEKRSR